MKQLILLLCLLGTFSDAWGQNQNPVKWTAVYKSISQNEGEVIITANIEKGWHTYSQRPTDAGPIPTSFSFTPSKDFETIGTTQEENAHEEFVKAFDAKIFVFDGKAEFRQKVKVKKKGTVILFNVDYMCCNDVMCLPPKTSQLSVKTP
jgi:DsbC/DsbD-like thiol-disulfide interchange protein